MIEEAKGIIVQLDVAMVSSGILQTFPRGEDHVQLARCGVEERNIRFVFVGNVMFDKNMSEDGSVSAGSYNLTFTMKDQLGNDFSVDAARLEGVSS